MKIKQVEELVGMTSKNIRFYEDQGLLTVDRADNGYREYHENHIAILKNIKLLRKLDVPVEEIRAVLNEKISLQDCLERHAKLLVKEQENLTHMQSLAEAIIQQNCTMQSLDTDGWLEQMEKMEKEGVDFVNLCKVDIHMKKKMGAVIGGTVMIVLMLFILGVLFWGNSVEPLPIGLFVAAVLAPVVVIVCIFVALCGRLKEIEGGEEDEAAKY